MDHRQTEEILKVLPQQTRAPQVIRRCTCESVNVYMSVYVEVGGFCP